MLEPYPKDDFSSLSPKQRWDVIAALRGPDCNTNPESIKWFSTSVIRGRMRKVMRVGGLINEDLNLIIVPNFFSFTKNGPFSFNAGHFFQHVSEAAEILSIPVIPISGDAYKDAIGSNYSHPSHAGVKFLAALKDEYKVGAAKKIAELERHLKATWGINPDSNGKEPF